MYLQQAVEEVISKAKAKFIETVDIAMNLNINPKKPEQNIRELIILPNPLPKNKKILIIDNTLSSKEIEELGIDYYGDEDMVEKIKSGWLDFDVLLTTNVMMPKLLKLGKILGPKGLMPTIKNGTITGNIKLAAKEFKDGKFEIKNDANGNLHIPFGKINFTKEQLIENFKYVINQVKKKKPQLVNGKFIKTIHISSTMGKSYLIDDESIK